MVLEIVRVRCDTASILTAELKGGNTTDYKAMLGRVVSPWIEDVGKGLHDTALS